MVNFPRIAVISAVFLGLLAATVRAEEVEDINLVRSKFFIDHAVFADTVENRLEVYYKIFNDGLHYVKKGDKYVANYEISIIVTGDKDRQITGRSIERNYVLEQYDLTRSDVGFLINQVSLPLPPGEFEMKCKLIDHNSNDASTIEAKIESPDYHLNADISDLQLIQEISQVEPTSPFSKGGIAAVPTVERSLDGEVQKLGFYTELYVSDYVGQKLELNTVVKSKRLGFESEKSIPITVDSVRIATSEFLDVSGLKPGEYTLSVSLVSNGKEVAKREEKFLLKWSLGSLLKNDFEYAVEQLKYIVGKDEKKAMLAAPDSERANMFEVWWRTKDPTPNTAENEFREEYYRRLRYANQYYSTINREGWLTDRGSVYIRWGEPDQIDRYPFELGRKPYQIWYYYSQRRAFYFVDDRGDGDLQLQYPFDGDWRQRGTIGP